MELLVSTEVKNNDVVCTSNAEEVVSKEQLIKDVLNGLVGDNTLMQGCGCGCGCSSKS